MMDNLANRTIKGYELKECVGEGGFGAVYRAYQSTVGREVAVKVILPQYANHPDFIRRFEVEAQLIARLEHPHIVPLYDYWRDPEGAYLVMRWLKGSLRDATGQSPWSVEAVSRLLEQIASALNIAHREGIIHRDIKPDNILLDEDENAYLADFGIAKDLTFSGNITAEGSLVGSPAYVSPEQIKGESVTPRSDIYSLGLVLYELLVNQNPYPEANTPYELMNSHLNIPIPSLTERRPNLPAALNEVLQTATAKDPLHRYASVLRFAAAFRAATPIASRAPAQPLPEPLTQRELDILRLMVEALSNQEIAQKLVLSLETVRWYLKQIYSKLDVHGRRQAIERAQQLDLFATPGQAQPAAAFPAVPGAEARLNGNARRLFSTSQLVNPYKGLRAFQETDAVDFFGRATLTEQLLARLLESGDGGRFLAVVGPSGSGKSSVIRAGLIPALRKGGLAHSERWFITDMLPGTHPFEELEAALLRVAISAQPDLLEQLREDRRGLVRAAKRILPSDPEVELVLIIDQFEELFTLLSDETVRSHFIDNILAVASDSRSRVRIVVTLRADFYDRPLFYPRLADLMRSHTEVVVPLTQQELERAIAGPAERVGVMLEPGLVNAILGEIGEQPGTLPLLQYALTELFERREDLTLTLDAYRASGGISGALARRADELFDDLEPHAQAAARQLFLRLVALGEGTEDTRRRIVQAEIASISAEERAMDDVLTAFGAYRLLTFDRDPVTRGPTVEIAHEALIREWVRLRGWLDDSRDDLRIQRRLILAAQEWVHSHHDASFLASGARLTQFEALSASGKLALNEPEQDYLRTSITEREAHQAEETARQERELALARQAAASAQEAAQSALQASHLATQAAMAQRQSANRLRYLAAVLLLFLVVAIGLSAFAFSSRARARESEAAAILQEQVARVGQLAAQALSNLEDQRDLALLLSVEANRIAATLPPQARIGAGDSLLRSLQAGPQFNSVLRGDSGYAFRVAFSPDSKLLASLSGPPKAIRLWDVASGKAVGQAMVTSTGGTIVSGPLAFSPDGKLLVSNTGDGSSIQLWDVESQQPFGRPLTGHTSYVTNAAFSPDGKLLASASGDSTIRLWDVTSGQPIGQSFTGHTGTVNSVAFSPDGSLLASGGGDSTIRLWDVASGRLNGQPVTGHTGGVNNVAFAPDGITLVSAGVDGTVRLWDAATGTLAYVLTGHTAAVNGVAFVSGRAQTAHTILMASASDDHTIRLWANGPLLAQVLSGHTDGVNSVSFSPDGKLLASASNDGTVRLWDLSSGQWNPASSVSFGQILSGHTKEVYGAAFSPDGKIMASASSDRTIRLWDAANGQQLGAPLSGHTGAVWSVAFSPDGKIFASASSDLTIRLWNSASGQLVGQPLAGHTDTVNSVAFSPDGKLLASASDDATIRLWDAASGQAHGEPLIGHQGGVNSVAFSPDGRLLASAGNDATIRLWDVASGKPIGQPFTGHNGFVVSVAFSPDGKLLASASNDHTVRLWDIASGQAVGQPLLGHTDAVRSVAFSPDGKTLASASADHTVRLWDVASGQALGQPLTGHNAAVWHVAFSPDGKTLVSASTDYTLRLWPVSVEAWTERACRIAARNLTQQEWGRYLGDEPYRKTCADLPGPRP